MCRTVYWGSMCALYFESMLGKSEEHVQGRMQNQELRQLQPKMKTAQVLRQVQQRWKTLSVDMKRGNEEAFQRAETAYKQEMDKAPERQKALDNMKTRIQIELKNSVMSLIPLSFPFLLLPGRK
ncbi:unnamed protein product [Caenorhabditis brenneri]